ncbi:GNAT family N-acetyltransferase [Viridibacillus arvi]|uniref:GNAT family N-acetyltransferase n=1 Tax=Viridibacillus arvi TaxID=263475 RepID=UPI003D0112BF
MDLEDEKAVLRKYEEIHFKKTVEWLNQETIKHNFGIKKNITLSQHEQWFANLENTFIKAIYDKENNLYIGNTLVQFNKSNQSAFFQIYIGEENVKGKGLATSTLQLVLDYLFLHEQYNRVWLKVFPDNKKALKLYRNFGFVLEGIERESYKDLNGFRNQMIFSILKKDWLDKQGGIENK